MASKRRLRRVAERLKVKECEGKLSHETQTDAVSHIIRLRRVDKDLMNSYKCQFCGNWHVGHKRIYG